MTSKINSDLAGRINQYVSYRRQVESSTERFKDTLSDKLNGADRTTGGTHGARPKRSSAVYARPHDNLSQRHITTLQARRLAQYAPSIQEASRRYNVPIELICAVILQESGGNAHAVSHCGARGLMQLMPGTARKLGVANSFDPRENIMGGTKYLRDLLDRFDGNVALALAGYNAGEGNVEKYGRKIPPFRETRAYVPNVLKYADTLWQILRSPVRGMGGGVGGTVASASVSASPTANAPAIIYHRTIFTTRKS